MIDRLREIIRHYGWRELLFDLVGAIALFALFYMLWGFAWVLS